ncbi:MAG: hypothetical protein CMJ89_02115 [Planctomycetes bacterium]|nr:hypothetical protein [Planctomycetota bacterium]
MNAQAKALADVAARVQYPWSIPSGKNLEGKSLLETGLYAVLLRRLEPRQAEKALRALVGAYPDWNELRVSQIQEFQGLIKAKKATMGSAIARDVKGYLQEIFQGNHSFDLEPYRGDLTEAAKFFTQLPFLGASAAHLLIHAIDPTVVPVSGGIVRVLDRMGLMKRTSSLRKAQASLEPLVPAGDRIDFGLRLGLVVERWCDSKRPSCWKCPQLESCPFGFRVHRDWEAQQKRVQFSREREKVRQLKEQERLRKRAEAEEKRLIAQAERVEAKRRREGELRLRAAEKKRLVLEEKRARLAAVKKAALAKKVAAKKAALAKKEAAKKAAAKMVAAKKAAAKKAAAKKAAAKKAAAKKAAAKKAAAKKKAQKRPSPKATRKKGNKSAPRKKSAKRKPAAAHSKRTAKKVVTKKKSKKRDTAKKKANGARSGRAKKARKKSRSGKR